MITDKILEDERVKNILNSLGDEREAVEKSLFDFSRDLEKSVREFEEKVKSVDLSELRKEIIRTARK